MINNDLICQQSAKVEYLNTMLSHGRCTPMALEAAKAKLQGMQKEMALFNNITPKEEATPAQPEAKQGYETGGLADNPQQMQHNLLVAHKQLRKQQSELGNQMAMIPKDVVALDATTELIAIQKKIEAIWDQYRFIERHGRLPEPADYEEKPSLSPAEIARLKDIKIDLKLARDQRLKLTKKLENPGKYATTIKSLKEKPAEWAAELDLVLREIKALEQEKLDITGDEMSE